MGLVFFRYNFIPCMINKGHVTSLDDSHFKVICSVATQKWVWRPLWKSRLDIGVVFLSHTCKTVHININQTGLGKSSNLLRYFMAALLCQIQDDYFLNSVNHCKCSSKVSWDQPAEKSSYRATFGVSFSSVFGPLHLLREIFDPLAASDQWI